MKTLFLVPMALGAILFSSCATNMAPCAKCGKPGCTMCAKSDAKCSMHGKVGCMACKGM